MIPPKLKCLSLQAPSNMKSVLQAGWLLTVAVGNIIVLIVAGVSAIQKQVSMQAVGVLLYYIGTKQLLVVLCNELKWLSDCHSVSLNVSDAALTVPTLN